MPPAPMVPTISYGPSLVPDVSGISLFHCSFGESEPHLLQSVHDVEVREAAREAVRVVLLVWGEPNRRNEPDARWIRRHELFPELLASRRDIELHDALRDVSAPSHVQGAAVASPLSGYVAFREARDRRRLPALDRVLIEALIRADRDDVFAVGPDALAENSIALRRDGLRFRFIQTLDPDPRAPFRLASGKDDPAAVGEPARLLDADRTRRERLRLARPDRIDHETTEIADFFDPESQSTVGGELHADS